MKKLIALLLALTVMVGMFAGCGKPAEEAAPEKQETETAAPEKEEPEAPAEEKPEETAEPVVLDWYLATIPQENQDAVYAEINKILLEELNIQVNFHAIDMGEYGQKMQMLMSSGEKIDMMFTSNWTNDFYADVAKGAYQPLDMAMIEEFGPAIMESVPTGAWEAAKVNGQLLAIPNVQVLARWPGLLVQNQYAEKYDFDLTAVDSLDDFTPLLQNIADNETGVYPIDVNKASNILSYYVSNMGLEYFAESNPFGVRIGDENLEVINIYDTEEMADFMNLLHSWYESGIIRADAASVTDTSSEKANGKLASIFCVNNPDTGVNQAKAMGLSPEDVTIVPLSDPYLSTSSVVATMVAINANSPYAKECIQVLNKFHDAEDTRCINLMSYGIEGVNYNTVEDDLIEQIPDSGYWVDCGWAYGSLFNCKRTNPVQPAWRPAGPDINAKATVSPMMGFSFNPENVKSELAQIAAVMDEFVPALMTGSVEVESTLADFLAKLDQAGAATVQAELQSQLDAFAAAK